MRRIPLALLISITAASAAGAAELTMDEAIQTALENNLSVQSAASRADAASARARQAAGHRLPQLDLSEIFSYTDNPAEVFAFQLNQERFDFDDFVLSDPNNPDPLTTWITRLELTLPIYTGGQLGARIDQAEYMASAEELRWYHAREQVVFDTITAFTNLAKAREHVELMTKARSTTAEHVELAESYAEQGLILQAEVLRAKVYLAEMDELLAQADNGARLAEAALNFQMGTDQTIPRQLTALPAAPATPGGLDDWISAAVEQRRDLEAARRELDAGRLEAKTAKPWYLPEIAASAKYDLYDDTIFGSHGGSGSIMAFARLDLYSGGKEAANGRRRTSTRRRTSSTSAASRRASDWRSSRRGTTSTPPRPGWPPLPARSHAAREAVRVREQRFTQGLDKMIDLLDAETALREAELRELVARYDVSLSTYRLLFVSGGTLTELTEESS